MLWTINRDKLNQSLRVWGSHLTQAQRLWNTFLSRSRGSVSDAEHPLFTSPNAPCHRSGSGRLDRPDPGRLLLCFELWHTVLLSSGSEPGSLTIRDTT